MTAALLRCIVRAAHLLLRATGRHHSLAKREEIVATIGATCAASRKRGPVAMGATALAELFDLAVLPVRRRFGFDAQVTESRQRYRFAVRRSWLSPSYRQMTGRLTTPVVTLVVRIHGDPDAFASRLRDTVREAEPGLVPESVATMEQRMLTGLARPKLYAILLGVLALCSLVVAAVGLFGVLSYAVAQRSREIGLRLALGARQSDVVLLMLRQAVVLTVAGTVTGLLASIAVTRFIGSMLYGVTARDGLTYVLVPVVLAVVATLACIVPARRAAGIDPLRTLRS